MHSRHEARAIGIGDPLDGGARVTPWFGSADRAKNRGTEMSEAVALESTGDGAIVRWQFAF